MIAPSNKLWRRKLAVLAMKATLVSGASLLPAVIAHAQGSVVTLGDSWWNGSYYCLQGQTALRLKTVVSPGGTVEALFQFGPTVGNSNVPNGAFLLRGTIRPSDGFLGLVPERWITQPPNYVMVGLSGTIWGNTYSGSVTGGYGCSNFYVSRQPMATAAPTANISTQPTEPQGTSRRQMVPLHSDGGTLTVPVLINNQLTLNFVIDSGAADVSIPADVVLTLMRTGTLSRTDFLGSKTYTLADGRIVPSETFRIRSLKVGEITVHDVTGSVASVQGSLLLGQSFLSRFKSWAIDNQQQALRLE